MATIDHIEIPHPCSASWAEMDGDARARFCRLCSKVVHDTLVEVAGVSTRSEGEDPKRRVVVEPAPAE